MGTDSKTFCILPWIHQMVDTNGTLRLCCTTTESDNFGGAGPQDMETIWNSPDMIEIRRKMMNGERVPICSACYDVEDHNGFSLRMGHNREFERFTGIAEASEANGYVVEDLPKYLDIRFSNLCNLSCKMCSGESSIQKIKEHERLKNADPDMFWQYGLIDWPGRENHWQENINVADTFSPYWTDLSVLYVTGGEPMLIPEAEYLLRDCVDSGYTQNIKLRLNTNLTVLNKNMIKYMADFKSVNLACSLDGVGSVFEYIRNPARWKTAEANLRRVLQESMQHPNISIYINMTIQLYNMLYIGETIDEFVRIAREETNLTQFSIQISHLYAPANYRIDTAPWVLRNAAYEKLCAWEKTLPSDVRYIIHDFDQVMEGIKTGLLCKMKISEDTENLNRWSVRRHLQFAEFHDQFKKISLQDNLPEMYDLMTGWVKKLEKEGY